MNVILLTVLALGGTGGEIHVAPADESFYADSPECVSGHSRKLHGSTLHGHCMGPMPQTCYDPPYGCYYGSRFNNRYPAFHGTYYRKAYNYRNYFDYPWHAELHEPTSNWSYNVTGDTGAPAPLPPVITPDAEKLAPPQPRPTQAAAEAPLLEEVRFGLAQPELAKGPSNSLRSLRR